MYLRPLLELGKRCSLSAACSDSGIPIQNAHQSSVDALASAKLWSIYLCTMQKLGIRTFKDLSERKSYKFFSSLDSDPLSAPSETDFPRLEKLRSRAAEFKEKSSNLKDRSVEKNIDRQDAIHRYWNELIIVLSDLQLSRDEIRNLSHLRSEFKLTPEEIRGLHARAFSDLLALTIQDRVINSTEQNQIKRLYQCLSKLGWAPGQ